MNLDPLFYDYSKLCARLFINLRHCPQFGVDLHSEIILQPEFSERIEHHFCKPCLKSTEVCFLIRLNSLKTYLNGSFVLLFFNTVFFSFFSLVY